MKTIIHLDGKPIVIEFGDFDSIFTEEITKIDHSNIYGEAVTISSLLARVGQLRALLEEQYDSKKLECSIRMKELEKKFRREANKTGGKFTVSEEGHEPYMIKLTENAITTFTESDPGVVILKNNEISAKKELGIVESIYWALQSKDKKLSNMTYSITPEEFYNELIEGSVNGILIKKPKIRYKNREK